MRNCQSLPLKGKNILSWRQPPGLVVSVSADTLSRRECTSNAVGFDGFFHPPSPPTTPPPALAVYLLHFCNAAHSLFNIIHYSSIPSLPHSHCLALTDIPSSQRHADIAVNTGLTFSTFFLEIFVGKSRITMFLHWRQHWIAAGDTQILFSDTFFLQYNELWA